ncbi:LuxR C-terminal-related transcriptional regulator [Streptomyces sp. NBC_01003]|uniref:LuxR C-terminal-related transcriptional regulator n=1 Tax=unclassified Streptomyces TaxID=2593676 RepID=UPI0037D755A5|nr:LuxR C-terminal-related transcriptional regulator [Streptomyces sp. NBC_01003]
MGKGYAMDGVLWRNRAMLLFDRIPMPVAVCEPRGTIMLANAAMAAECDTTPGRLKGRDILHLFRPRDESQLHRIAEALRLRRRSRYQVSVTWETPDGALREGELTVDPVSDTVERTPDLLVMLRVVGERPAALPDRPRATAGAAESRILELLAAGATTAQAARETGLTTDGVNYHLRRLTRRWGATNRTELVARAYASGVLTPGVWPPRAAGPDG